jgi:meiotic recombination protein SPO11
MASAGGSVPAGGRKGKRDAAAAAALAFKKRLKGPEEILAKVRKLSARVKAEPELMKTITDLGLANECREVVDKDSDAVLDEIEAVVFEIAMSILEGEGYAFEMPSRSKANQMYVPELDRIVLKSSTQKRPFASVQTVKKTTITTRCLLSSSFLFLTPLWSFTSTTSLLKACQVLRLLLTQNYYKSASDLQI